MDTLTVSSSTSDDTWTPVLDTLALEVRGSPHRERIVPREPPLAFKEEFVLRNASSQTITFHPHVSASCACSSVELSHDIVPPNSTTILSATIAPPAVGDSLTADLNVMLMSPVVTPVNLRVTFRHDSDWRVTENAARIRGIVGDKVTVKIPFEYYGTTPDLRLIRPTEGEIGDVIVREPGQADIPFSLTIQSDAPDSMELALFAKGRTPEVWHMHAIVTPLLPATWRPSVVRLTPGRAEAADLVLTNDVQLLEVKSLDDTVFVALTNVSTDASTGTTINRFRLTSTSSEKNNTVADRHVVANVRYNSQDFITTLRVLNARP